jgi:hypothetical protein
MSSMLGMSGMPGMTGMPGTRYVLWQESSQCVTEQCQSV